jgi:hypothetical protein
MSIEIEGSGQGDLSSRGSAPCRNYTHHISRIIQLKEAAYYLIEARYKTGRTRGKERARVLKQDTARLIEWGGVKPWAQG